MVWVWVLAVLPLVVAFVFLCLREPMRVALPIYAALVPFGGAFSVGPSRYGSASSVVGIVLAAGLAVQLVIERRDATRVPPTVPVWITFLGVAYATSLWTINRPETLSGLAVVTSLVAVFVLAAFSEVDRAVVRRVENGLLAGGAAAVGYGFYQLVTLGGFISDQPGAAQVGDGRFGNGMLGPNIEAVTLLLPFSIALHRTFDVDEPRRGRVLAAGAAALMLTGVLMTGSRTGTLGAGLVMLVLAVTGPARARRGLLTTLLLGAVLSAAVWVLHPFGLAERTFASATSSSGRLDIWQVGLQACRQYCSLGSGWGTFPDVYADTQALVPSARVLTGSEGSYQPHNLWLLALIETGIVGMLLFSAGLAVCLREALRLPVHYRGRATGALLGLAFGVFFLSSMEFKIFWMVLLMVTLYGNVTHAESLQPVADEEPASDVPVPDDGPG